MQLSRAPTRTAATAPRASRRTLVVRNLTLAEATDWIGKALVRVFTPDENKNVKYPINNFTGRISHHDAPRRPFKDQFSSNAPLPPSSALEPAEPSAAGYVDDAVKGAVAGLRPILPEEPTTWNGAEQDPAGWKADVHKSGNKRDSRDGFHVKKY